MRVLRSKRMEWLFNDSVNKGQIEVFLSQTNIQEGDIYKIEDDMIPLPSDTAGYGACAITVYYWVTI